VVVGVEHLEVERSHLDPPASRENAFYRSGWPPPAVIDSIEQVFDAVRMATEAALGELAERVRPVALAQQQRLPVLAALEPLLPGAGLRRGSTVSVSAVPGVGGATLLALALVAEASRSGSWLAAVGLPSLGLVAADEVGVALERVVLVAAPERDGWGNVVAALVDGFDLVLLHTGRGGMRPTDARRLVARARERGAVLVQLGTGWHTEADLALQVVAARWEGLEDDGYGHLQTRRVTVARTGRGEAAQPRQAELWLPGPAGTVDAVIDEPVDIRVQSGRAASTGSRLRAV
jgi:hypothetical protein